MDLFSDFKSEKWIDKGPAPDNKKNLTGYQTFDIIRTLPSDSSREDIRYYLTSDAGTPYEAVLYGAKRDPLKSIGHCYMKVAEKNEAHVITGIIVEEDWVEMKAEYLPKIHIPIPVVEKRESVDMGMSSDMDPEKWTKKGCPPKMKSTIPGYGFYNIVRDHPDSVDGSFEYYLCADGGEPCTATLHGALRDPLKSIGNCFMRITKDRRITGIIVEEDWIEMK